MFMFNHDKRMNPSILFNRSGTCFKKIILLPNILSDEGWLRIVFSSWTTLASSTLSFLICSSSISWWCFGSVQPVYPTLCWYLPGKSRPDASAYSLRSSDPLPPYGMSQYPLPGCWYNTGILFSHLFIPYRLFLHPDTFYPFPFFVLCQPLYLFRLVVLPFFLPARGLSLLCFCSLPPSGLSCRIPASRKYSFTSSYRAFWFPFSANT